MLAASKRLFSAAPKDERIAPFKADDIITLERAVNQDGIYFLLRQAMTGRLFARVYQFGFRVRLFQQLIRNQAIINDDMRAPQQAQPLDCDQNRDRRDRRQPDKPFRGLMTPPLLTLEQPKAKDCRRIGRGDRSLRRSSRTTRPAAARSFRRSCPRSSQSRFAAGGECP